MTRKTVTWDDFGGGDYGDMGGWDAPRGTFTGLNMRVNRDGSLSPRKGAVNLAPSGLGVGANEPFRLSAVALPEFDDRRIWCLFGASATALRSASVDAEEQNIGVAWQFYTAGGSWPLYSEVPEVIDDESEAYFGSTKGPPEQLIKVDHQAKTMTQIGTAGAQFRPWLHNLATYGDRMFSADNNPLTRNRVRFSNPPDTATGAYDYGSLPAANFFTVGSPTGIRHLQQWRNGLLIFKPFEVWRFEGNPAGSAVLRRVGAMSVRTKVGRGRLYAVSSDGDRLWIGADGQRPAYFDGTRCNIVENIDLGRRRTHLVCSLSDGTSGVMYVDGLNRRISQSPPGWDWLFTGQRWLRWQLTRPNPLHLQTDNDTTPPLTGAIDYPRSAVVASAFGRKHLFWSEKQVDGATTTVPLFRLDLDSDGPGTEFSPNERCGDGSATALNAFFSLPYFVAADGKQATVRKVRVRGRRYRTFGALTNHFDLTVVARQRHRGGADASSAVQAWDQADSAAGPTVGDSSAFEAEFTPSAPAGHTIELAFSNVRGVAISSVVAEIDIAGEPT